jgi:MFS transporter, DHA1 family, multidrug resistance protein
VDSSPRPVGTSRRSRALLVVVLGGVCAMGPLATDLYLPAMPDVAADLGTSQQAVALTVSAFLMGLALGQLLAGPLSDTYGRRPPLLAGLGVFTLSSLLCPLVPSAGWLVALRVLQGIAGASGIAIANAVVTDRTRGRAAARLLSRLALVTGMAPIVAPLIGSQILRFTSWRGVFVAQALCGLMLLAGVVFGLRESLPRERRVPLGLASTTEAARTLGRDSTFVGLALTSALTYAAFFAYLAASSFVVQEVYGASPTTYAVLFSINAVGMLGASQLNHFLLSRFPAHRLLAMGLLVTASAGLLLLAATLVGDMGVVIIAVPLFLLVAGTGIVNPDATALALSRHPGIAGSASATFGSLRLGLGAVGSSLVGIGGSISGLPLALVVVVATLGALAVFAVIAPRAREVATVVDTPEEAAVDMPVG